MHDFAPREGVDGSSRIDAWRQPQPGRKAMLTLGIDTQKF
jgi:hypothetical protein